MDTVGRINHALCSCPHFANVSHSSVLGIERRFPIKGSFLGPGGRCSPGRRPLIQYTTKTVRVPITKASWGSVICSWESQWYDFKYLPIVLGQDRIDRKCTSASMSEKYVSLYMSFSVILEGYVVIWSLHGTMWSHALWQWWCDKSLDYVVRVASIRHHRCNSLLAQMPRKPCKPISMAWFPAQGDTTQ